VSESVISKDTAVDVKAQTIDRRRLHDRTLRQFTQALPHLWSLGSQTVPFVLVANNVLYIIKYALSQAGRGRTAFPFTRYY